jgi:hypothetical protein
VIAAGRHGTPEQNGRLSAAVGLLLLAVATTACGKKGPPLAPFSNLPAAVTSLTAKRVGAQVVFQFTVPTTNIDGRQPADLDRVDLYAHTTRPVLPGDYLKRGTIVGSVKVPRPAAASEGGASAPPPHPGVDQGAVATLVETPDFSAPQLEPPVPAPEIDVENRPLFPEGGGPLLSPRRATFAARYYVAVGVNRRGRPGPPSAVVEMPLVPPPAPPIDVTVTYTEKSLSVSWAPPALPLARPIQAPSPQEGALPSRPVTSAARSSGYNLYEVPPSTASADSTSAVPALRPLNASLLTSTGFEDSRIEFGAERCFVVRSQETLGTVTVESAASQTACVTPVDTFRPAPPRSVAAVASEGAISLIWEPNDEADLAGYLVLRGDAPGEKLQALTTAPLTDTTYRDTTVRSGVAYVYAVVAVDKANNISEQSDPIGERGR